MTTYPGGKNGSGVYQKIINEMPPHRLYIEPFLGHGAIMRLKRTAIASIGIDADENVIRFWRALDPATPNLTLMNADALDWLASHATDGEVAGGDTLIYLDPPYLWSTRRQHRVIYRCEMSNEQHEILLGIITGLRCMVMISGYWSEMYAKALGGWRAISFEARTRGGGTATEWLWMNFQEPMELHDYRYLGDTFRERERIQRKTARWKARLLGMEPLERHAIMHAIDEIRKASPATAIAAGKHR